MSGHTIELPICTLMLKMVELWRCQVINGYLPSNYEWQMTRYCNEYQQRTGTKCNTVGEIAVLEEWYDGLSNDERDAIRKDLIIKPI